MALASDKNISIGVCQPDPDKILALLNGDTTNGTVVTN
jgi:hypothetical protein